MNGWHINHGLDPEFKKAIREVAEANPLRKDFIPGQGQRLADKAIDEGRSRKIELMPDLGHEGKIKGFLSKRPGEGWKLAR